jgi:hypothetical protein
MRRAPETNKAPASPTQPLFAFPARFGRREERILSAHSGMSNPHRLLFRPPALQAAAAALPLTQEVDGPINTI